MSYLFDSNILILSATPGLQLQPLLLAPGGASKPKTGLRTSEVAMFKLKTRLRMTEIPRANLRKVYGCPKCWGHNRRW